MALTLIPLLERETLIKAILVEGRMNLAWLLRWENLNYNKYPRLVES